MEDDKKYCAYMHTHKINDKKYIGITCRKPEHRWVNGRGYKPNKKQKQNNTVFYNAILKYGWNSFKHEVLAENLTKEEAYKLEQELIVLYNSKSPNGYNLTDGGHGTFGVIVTDERRRKISESLKLRYERFENKNKGKKRTEAQIEKLKNRPVKRGMDSPMYGTVQSDENKKKISESLREYFRHNDNVMAKPITQYLTDGTFIREWKSMTLASKELGINGTSISVCCSGKYKTSAGFVWRHKGDSFDKYEVEKRDKHGKNSNCSICVKMFDFQGNFIKLFHGLKEAERETGANSVTISKCCRGLSNCSGGYVWRLEDDEFDKYKFVMPRKVSQYDLDNKKINEYKSCKEASRKTGLIYHHINNCCLGKLSQYGGYIFKYE